VTATPARALEPLEPAEARALLATADLGRLAYTEGALPAVQPVRFALHRDTLVIPTSCGSEVAQAGRGSVLALQADAFDVPSGTGWSVTAVGASRLVKDADEVAAWSVAAPEPWAPAAVLCYVLVRVGLVSGHRVRSTLPHAAAS
jgi:nitroimidazol reductase NimA-like FMN-containing flavoprotein (pyridoxamine 5'-phosphate oxidase superfamily)